MSRFFRLGKSSNAEDAEKEAEGAEKIMEWGPLKNPPKIPSSRQTWNPTLAHKAR